ncbi:hypothetical protein D3C78_1616760 [compost metagenome]
MRDSIFNSKEGALQIRCQRLVPCLGRQILYGCESSVNACISKHYIDGSKLLGGRFNRLLYPPRIGYIRIDEEGLSPDPLNILLNRLRTIIVQVEQTDFCSLLG